jgi:site-specific recombinase XerD
MQVLKELRALTSVPVLMLTPRGDDIDRILGLEFGADDLVEYRAAMLEKKLSASTVNVRLSEIRKLVGEAQRNGILDAEQAAKMTDVPNLRQQGTRLGNWLTRDQAKELLAVPDGSTIKGKRDYCILALLVGCALRQKELSTLTPDDVQLREGRWVIVDLVGKGGRAGTVAIPVRGLCQSVSF